MSRRDDARSDFVTLERAALQLWLRSLPQKERTPSECYDEAQKWADETARRLQAFEEEVKARWAQQDTVDALARLEKVNR
jgi:hypothetical protein